MIFVRIKENSWLARWAAKKMKCNSVALVVGRTIYLHNRSPSQFLQDKQWVLHELKHVEQYQKNGWIRFLWLYGLETLKNGYANNRFEVEARASVHDETLLAKYRFK
ncbi:MAG: DUF4157 domain-containing protein [Bacteroidetes bacterium]|nr:DUF4157 domain-containing protein [Bacteroidota bacterium]